MIERVQGVACTYCTTSQSGTWRARVDRIVVVDCTEATQVARVMQRSGWSAEAVQRIVDQQASRTQRRAIADAVIVNEALGLAQLDAEVDALWARWAAK